jgi:hypothetical protein
MAETGSILKSHCPVSAAMPFAESLYFFHRVINGVSAYVETG